MRMLIDAAASGLHACMARDLVRIADDAAVLTAGLDVSDYRFEVGIVGWLDGEPIAWQRGDVCSMISGPYVRRGWVSRCLDPATGLWETYRLGRRAARRQRGRDRAARRLTARDGIA